MVWLRSTTASLPRWISRRTLGRRWSMRRRPRANSGRSTGDRGRVIAFRSQSGCQWAAGEQGDETDEASGGIRALEARMASLGCRPCREGRDCRGHRFLTAPRGVRRPLVGVHLGVAEGQDRSVHALDDCGGRCSGPLAQGLHSGMASPAAPSTAAADGRPGSA
jgi:hypothetical protein